MRRLPVGRGLVHRLVAPGRLAAGREWVCPPFEIYAEFLVAPSGANLEPADVTAPRSPARFLRPWFCEFRPNHETGNVSN